MECNFPYIKDANSESKPLQLDNSCMKNKDCLKFSSGSRTFPPVWPVTAGNEKQGLYAAVIWLPQYGATIQTIVISKPELKFRASNCRHSGSCSCFVQLFGSTVVCTYLINQNNANFKLSY